MAAKQLLAGIHCETGREVRSLMQASKPAGSRQR